MLCRLINIHELGYNVLPLHTFQIFPTPLIRSTFCIFHMSDTFSILLFFFLQASPWPDVIWLKDGVPVSKRVTISNAEGGSQILIPSAERSDTGIYTIIVKNIVGQETFSIEIRVTGKMGKPVYVCEPICIIFKIPS